ncbi:hypothetical protein lbkm_0168 [Lachnospiraceae bacterium KM106-2]|nr:hypothetical protein lbkm_0168 [Lachnospiraceae bacterium KM106-2]
MFQVYGYPVVEQVVSILANEMLLPIGEIININGYVMDWWHHPIPDAILVFENMDFREVARSDQYGYFKLFLPFYHKHCAVRIYVDGCLLYGARRICLRRRYFTFVLPWR